MSLTEGAMKAIAVAKMSSHSRTHPEADRLPTSAVRRLIFLVMFICLVPLGCGLDGVVKPAWLSDSPAPPEKEGSQVKALYGNIISHLENSADDRTGFLNSRKELEKHIAKFPEDKLLPEIAILRRVFNSLVSVTDERNRVTAESLSRADSVAQLEELLKKSAGEKDALKAKAEDILRRSADEKNTLEAKVEELTAEKEELLSIIEKLKALEIDMGQKRRKVR